MIGIQRGRDGIAVLYFGGDHTRVGFWFRLPDVPWTFFTVQDDYWYLRIWRFAAGHRSAKRRAS